MWLARLLTKRQKVSGRTPDFVSLATARLQMQIAVRMDGWQARPKVVMHVTDRPPRAAKGSLPILLPTDSRGGQYRVDESEVYFDRV